MSYCHSALATTTPQSIPIVHSAQKRYDVQPWNALTLQLSLSLLLVFRVFFIFLDARSEFSSSFMEASSEIGRKIKYLQDKQRTRHNMQGLRCNRLSRQIRLCLLCKFITPEARKDGYKIIFNFSFGLMQLK